MTSVTNDTTSKRMHPVSWNVGWPVVRSSGCPWQQQIHLSVLASRFLRGIILRLQLSDRSKYGLDSQKSTTHHVTYSRMGLDNKAANWTRKCVCLSAKIVCFNYFALWWKSYSTCSIHFGMLRNENELLKARSLCSNVHVHIMYKVEYISIGIVSYVLQNIITIIVYRIMCSPIILHFESEWKELSKTNASRRLLFS